MRIVATMALCEAAAYYKTKDMTLWDAMIQMYERYGYYKDEVTSITLKGMEGLEEDSGDHEQPAGKRSKGDRRISGNGGAGLQERYHHGYGFRRSQSTGLPSSNVLYYELTDDAWVCVRPSGTEPKVKFYFGIKGTSLEDADRKASDMKEAVSALVEGMM